MFRTVVIDPAGLKHVAGTVVVVPVVAAVARPPGAIEATVIVVELQVAVVVKFWVDPSV